MYQYEQAVAEPTINMDGQQVDPPPALTRDFLLRNKLPVWVITATRPLGPMALAIRNVTPGQHMKLKFIKSKLPQNVTDQIGLDKLASAADFWKVVRDQNLILVWPADADRMHGQNGGADQARVQAGEFSAMNPTLSPRVEAIERAQEFGQAAPQANEDNVLATVMPRVVDISLRAEAGDIKVEEAISQYDEVVDDMSERDLAFALGKAKPGKLREWLQNVLASRAGQKTATATAPQAKGKKNR